MEGTTRLFRGNLVQAGWLILLIFALTTFVVDANTAVSILIVGMITAIPFKVVEFDTTSFSGLWETTTPQRNSFDEAKRDALSLLRRRYARGDLTEEEFEQKLERLLETETIEQIEEEFESDCE